MHNDVGSQNRDIIQWDLNVLELGLNKKYPCFH